MSSRVLPDFVSAPRTDAIYNCHAYLTKVPVAGVIPFIESHTAAGEVVLDPFAGSGMTGIAATLCGRQAVLSDLSVFGRHIATGYLTGVDEKKFRDCALVAIDIARQAMGDLYNTIDTEGRSVEMVRTIWSFTYRCPSCERELVYADHLDEKGRAPKLCPRCQAPFSRRRWSRGKDVPVRVVHRNDQRRLVEGAVGECDRRAIDQASHDPRQQDVPSLTIEPHREMFRRSALGKHGLAETRSFFSSRNALALLELWRAIRAPQIDSEIRTKLGFAFTAILPRASRRYQWGPKRPLNAQGQTYYIAPVHFEWNIFELFGRKIEAAIRSDRLVFAREKRRVPASGFRYELASADALDHVGDESIDYVFTDPPFGSNIFYSDMALFFEAWLGEVTDSSREAVVHTAREKRGDANRRYEELLVGAFAEAHRVLKPGHRLSVVFGNSRGELWAMLLRALRRAGFGEAPEHVAILDKGQRSVKGLTSGVERVVTLDLILTFRKPRQASRERVSRPRKKADVRALIQDVLAELDDERARDPSALYVATLREAIRRGVVVEELHLGEVLKVAREAGSVLDAKSGRLDVAPNLDDVGA